MISQRRFALRNLAYWWLLSVGCAGPGAGMAAYGFLVADAALYAIGSLWCCLIYLPAAIALILWRRIEPLVGWPGPGWWGWVQFWCVVFFSVCWYGAMIGTALWRFV